MFDQRTTHVAFLLLAKHRSGDWDKITATLDHSWPGLDQDTLDDALTLAGRIIDGSATTRWAVA